MYTAPRPLNRSLQSHQDRRDDNSQDGSSRRNIVTVIDDDDDDEDEDLILLDDVDDGIGLHHRVVRSGSPSSSSSSSGHNIAATSLSAYSWSTCIFDQYGGGKTKRMPTGLDTLVSDLDLSPTASSDTPMPGHGTHTTCSLRGLSGDSSVSKQKATDESSMHCDLLKKDPYSINANDDNDENAGYVMNDWNSGLFACLRHGLCHASLTLAFCGCSVILLGQVMTRLSLDHCFHITKRPKTTVVMMFALLNFVLLDQILSLLTIPRWHRLRYESTTPWSNEQDLLDSVPFWLYAFLALRAVWRCTAVVLLVVWTARTRRRIRQQHDLFHGSLCNDVCASLWCHCCVVSQMARQTAHYADNKRDCYDHDNNSRTLLDGPLPRKADAASWTSPTGLQTSTQAADALSLVV